MSDPTPQQPEARSTRSPGSALVLVAVTASWTVSMLGFYAQPQLLGPIMRDLALGEERVAWLFSFENIAFGIATLAAAGPLARWSRVRAALAGGLLACLGTPPRALPGASNNSCSPA